MANSGVCGICERTAQGVGNSETHPFLQVARGQNDMDRCAQYNITKTSSLEYKVPLDTSDIEAIDRE